jgi:hypothetical protein
MLRCFLSEPLLAVSAWRGAIAGLVFRPLGFDGAGAIGVAT